jgi:hypothetical protein
MELRMAGLKSQLLTAWFGIVALMPLAIPVAAEAPIRTIPVPTMPAMTATDLNGRELSLPGALSGDPSVWIVAFDRAHQPQVDRLFGLLAQAKAKSPGLVFWEIPVIQDPGAVARWFIDNGMRSGIPKTETRAKVITLYVPDRAAWVKRVGIRTVDQTYAVLVGPKGEIRAVGSQSELQTAAAMSDFIANAAK